MSRNKPLIPILLGLLAWSSAPSARGADKPARATYESVAPILKKYCAGCHNAEDREGKLSLESYADLQKGGERGPALLPGNAASSRLIRMLTGKAEPRMPPEDNEAPSAGEIELLTRWVASGAKGPKGREPARDTLITPKIDPFAGPPAVTAMDSSPDGRYLAVARFKTVELLDAKTRKVVRKLGGHPGKVNSIRFTGDGRRIATSSGVAGLYGMATLWEASSGKPIARIKGHRDTMYAAVVAPDGKILATASYDRKIILWDLTNGKPIRTLGGHNGAVYDLDFNADGSVLASASADETIKLWRVADGFRLDTMGQPLDEQFVVRFSPDQKYVVAAGADNRIRVWRFDSRAERKINPLVHARFAHENAIIALRFAQDGKRLLSAGEDRGLKLWETEAYTQLHDYPQQPDVVSAVAAPLKGRSFTIGRMDGSVVWLDVATAKAAINQPTRVAASAAGDDGKMQPIEEREPNNSADKAQVIKAPALVSGVIHGGTIDAADVDLFRFSSKAGQRWVLEIEAARNKSALDSHIEVLDDAGQPIPRVLLQAVRDSYFTFRGQNSDTVDGFRLHNWQEMELNEYLFCNGEVVKLWHYPRGPDSGFMLYPGSGKRRTFFDTSASSHPLQEPCYIVEPREPGADIIPNGLPVFTLNYENDDDSQRKLGPDSKLTFVAPRDGEFLARVADVRGEQSEKHKYKLSIRPLRPGFKVTLGGANPTVNAGSGKEFTLTAERIDDFEGEIRVEIEGLPPGFHAPSPLVIQAGQDRAFAAINAAADAVKPTPENAKATKITATAMVDGEEVTHEVNNFGEIKLADKPKLLIRLAKEKSDERYTADKPLELVIQPGETITAKVIAERNGFKGRVSFGNADSGRNLPHGVYVDNIGLNGLMIVEGQTERSFFITAAKWVPETTRVFHLMARVEGNQTSWPVVLHVRKK